MIDTDTVLEHMRDVVEEFGYGYVYPQAEAGGPGPVCAYIRDGEYSCLIGHVLGRLGVSADELSELEMSYGGPIDAMAEYIDLDFTPDTVEVMAAAQSKQDAGDTWGLALRCAENAANFEE